MAYNPILSLNQGDIFQQTGTGASIAAETEVDFVKACQRLVFQTVTSDLLVDLSHTALNTGGASCTRVFAGAPLVLEITQPIQKIYVKSVSGTGSYSILAY